VTAIHIRLDSLSPHVFSTQIFHRKSRQRRDKDRKGPAYFRESGRLDCSEFSRSNKDPTRYGFAWGLGISHCPSKMAPFQITKLGARIVLVTRLDSRSSTRFLAVMVPCT